jgi:hypothetical protein
MSAQLLDVGTNSYPERQAYRVSPRGGAFPHGESHLLGQCYLHRDGSHMQVARARATVEAPSAPSGRIGPNVRAALRVRRYHLKTERGLGICGFSEPAAFWAPNRVAYPSDRGALVQALLLDPRAPVMGPIVELQGLLSLASAEGGGGFRGSAE